MVVFIGFNGGLMGSMQIYGGFHGDILGINEIQLKWINGTDRLGFVEHDAFLFFSFQLVLKPPIFV